MKIGFLFNHDQIHQVAHSLPIAVALRRDYPDAEIVTAVTNARLASEVTRLSLMLGMRMKIVRLGLTRRSSRLAKCLLEAVVPVSKLAIYRDNLDFFRSLDALVVAEKTSLLLKTRYKLDHLKIIHTRHGAGDRAIGFNKASAGFDHVLVSGAKIADRLARDAGVAPERMSVVGYPKFDLLAGHAPRSPFADPTKPTVLYNPHPSPHLSSWFKHGRQVLEHFLQDDRYNLIFAPHVMLFHRPFVVSIDKLRIDRPGLIEDRFLDAPNIHIDLGSRASTDMSYTRMADLYLGDVSSQIYEFLHTQRPCLFLNSHDVAHRGDPNYAHWQAGEVLGDPVGLGEALDRAFATHHAYLPVQRTLFERSFELTAEPSSQRAARAIMSVLGVQTAPTPLTRPAAEPAASFAA
ncbi:hypothetical protein [Sphingomonas sp. AP4-R1]|uniref:hypothetical protein n=1 Tax=Sphingomonas sp. AP4-R1 TaxID=2735134 RepID=UPI0020A39CEE|nr:hypothetical protein [Sphingomonas sp. AP4-R1]